jgi:hypothetical protein
VAVVVTATFSLSFGEVSVLFVKVSVPARVLTVPVVGRVTLVAPVEVRVTLLAPEVTRFPAISMLPASLILLAALTISRVSVRPAVRVVEETAARVTS